MAAAMNGISTHGGFAPAGGTFLCFTDYARPSMRIAALSHTPVVYVMTHDSIGLGEDGPTHQPVEHLAALRAMPNMRVFRPADAVETAECWQLALENTTGPTVLALSRQNLTPVRTVSQSGQSLQHGGYELVAAQGEAKVSLFASGSEVEIAVAAQKELAGRGIATRVVSVPSLELLLAQPAERRNAIIGGAPVKIGDRGRGPLRLGCGDRTGGHFRRHEQLRRQRAGESAIQAFRHHAGGGGRGRVKAPESRSSAIGTFVAYDALQRADIPGINRHKARRSAKPAAKHADLRTFEEKLNGSPGRYQRVWPHRPQCAPGHRRVRAATISRWSASTISARSRPTRICCASIPCTAGFPAP